MKKLSLLSAVALFLLTACQSMQKLYEAGEYPKAYKAALKQLQDDPDDSQALVILENSLQQILSEDELEIMNFRQQQTTSAWKSALSVIEEDQENIDAAEPYLGDRFLEEKVALSSTAAGIREDLYYHLLSGGKGKLQEAVAANNAALAQRAYHELRSAQSYSEPEFEEVDQLPQLIQSAEEAGVVYYQVELNKGNNIGLGADIERRFSDLEDHSSQFQQIELVFIANGGDCAIDIDFGSFATRIEEQVETDKYEKEVVISYDQEVDSLGVVTQIPVYETVFAEVQTVTSRKIANWTVDVDVDAQTNNCQHLSSRYSEELVSETAHYRTSGDLRALPVEYQAADELKQHTDDDDMAAELLDRFYSQICADYFSG